MKNPLAEVELNKEQISEALTYYFNEKVFRAPVNITSIEFAGYDSRVTVTFGEPEPAEVEKAA